MFLLESPHWGEGDSNEYKQYTVFNIKKKITLNIPNLQPRDYFPGTQERVRNIRSQRAISVRAIEVLPYLVIPQFVHPYGDIIHEAIDYKGAEM